MPGLDMLDMAVLTTWLWQGLLVVAVVEVALRFASGTGASTRYVVWWATLVAVLGLPWLARSGAAPVAEALEVGGAALGTAPAATAWQLPAPSDGVLLTAAALWAGLVVCRLVVLGAGVVRLRAIKQASVPMPIVRERRLAGWCAVRGSGRPVQLRLSIGVPTASVLGLTSPIIVIPPSLEAGLTDEELDAVVLHECAHVRRWDDWGRLAQMLIEVCVAFHPAVWLIGRRLNLEREVACDDWVLHLGTPSRTYAAYLATVAGLVRLGRIGLAPGVAHSGGSLAVRIQRLLDRQRNRSVGVSGCRTFAWVTGLGIAICGFAQLAPVVTFASSVAAAGDDRVGWTARLGPPARVAVRDEVERAPQDDRVEPADVVTADILTTAPDAPADTRVILPAAPLVTVGVAPAGVALGPPQPRGAGIAWERPMAAPHGESALLRGSMVEAMALPPVSVPTRGPWSWTAVTAAKVGGGTKRAGLATAGYFSWVGKSIARAF